MKITLELLRAKRACVEQTIIFRQEWPEGAEITQENCLRAAALGLSINWAVGTLLSLQAYENYERETHESEVAFDRQHDKLRAQRCRDLAAADAAYATAIRHADVANVLQPDQTLADARQQVHKTYNDGAAAASLAYNLVRGQAFYDLYCKYGLSSLPTLPPATEIAIAWSRPSA